MRDQSVGSYVCVSETDITGVCDVSTPPSTVAWMLPVMQPAAHLRDA